MNIRIWLKPVANARITTTQEKGVGGEMRDVHHLGNFRVSGGKDGEGKYIDYYGDPLDPTSVIVLRIDRKHVRRITCRDKYFDGFRTEGLYKLKGAVARVVTKRPYKMYGQDDAEDPHQEIAIAARSIKTLREIYTKVRSGELEPTADWGVHQTILAHKTREATDKRTTSAGDLVSTDVESEG